LVHLYFKKSKLTLVEEKNYKSSTMNKSLFSFIGRTEKCVC